MTVAQQYIVDSDESAFDRDVLQPSSRHLILVDFWAPWCGPCRSLAPILEKLMIAYSGAARLVKVNTDEQQQLASRYGIRSLPTVILFRNGEPVDQFMGVQPESAIRRMIDKHVVRESDEQLVRAESLHASGDTAGAIDMLVKTISDDPDNDRPRFMLAGWLADQKRFEEARKILDGITRDGKDDPRYAPVSARVDLGTVAESNQSVDELIRSVTQDADNLEARFQLAGLLVREGELANALEHLIEIIQRDRNFREDEPRRIILRVFDLAGGKGELVSEYRKRLARALN